MNDNQPETPKREGRQAINVWLTDEERQMLEALMTLDTRNISDTVRYAIRQTYAIRTASATPTQP